MSEDKKVTDEELLNEILLAFLIPSTHYKLPSKELVKCLANKFGKTELIIEDHLKILQKRVKDEDHNEVIKLVSFKFPKDTK